MATRQQTAPRPEQIIEATRALFIRYGVRRTAMDDIAREAGVAKATLYSHFAGKEDVFRNMILRCRALIEERSSAAEALDAPVADRLAALLDGHCGTALEWFGDAAHVGELRALVADHAADLGPSPEASFPARVVRLLETAAAAGELDLSRLSLPASRLAEIVINAAAGAKRSVTPSAYRDKLRDIALVACAAAAPVHKGGP